MCGNSTQAKASVALLCHKMGFTPVDMGPLSSSVEVENIPLYLFPSWSVPLFCTLALFVFFYLYNFTRDILQPYIMTKKSLFYKMPIDTVNVTLPCVALVMLSLVYAPGLCAAFLQLQWGTKYRRFPARLDRWLVQRKQFGLCSFLCAALHAIYSLCLPMRKSARYNLLNAAFKQVSFRQLLPPPTTFLTGFLLSFYTYVPACAEILEHDSVITPLTSLCVRRLI